MSKTESERTIEPLIDAHGPPLLHAGALLIDVIDCKWKETAETLIDSAQHRRIWRLGGRLLKRREKWPRVSNWLVEIAAHVPPIAPNKMSLALGPRWWRRIDAATLTPTLVHHQVDPLTRYAAGALAWAENVREMRSGALAHALSPLFGAISSGTIRLTGIRRPALAASGHEELPVGELQFRQWSFEVSGTVTLYPPGADPIYFSDVRLVDRRTAAIVLPAEPVLESEPSPNKPDIKKLGLHVVTTEGSMAAMPSTIGNAAISSTGQRRKCRRGPEPGKVNRYERDDRALYQELENLTRYEGLTLTAATQRLADHGKVKGTGTPISRAARLQRRYRKDRE